MSQGPDQAANPRRAVVSAASKPALPRHVKLRRDKARCAWTILAPERIFTPDAIAVAVLQLCDGNRTVDEIADSLAQSYTAPKEAILADIVAMLQGLADKGVVKT
jgi:pyrroloquinoline quinone biosynthesis protein D